MLPVLVVALSVPVGGPVASGATPVGDAIARPVGAAAARAGTGCSATEMTPTPPAQTALVRYFHAIDTADYATAYALLGTDLQSGWAAAGPSTDGAANFAAFMADHIQCVEVTGISTVSVPGDPTVSASMGIQWYRVTFDARYRAPFPAGSGELQPFCKVRADPKTGPGRPPDLIIDIATGIDSGSTTSTTSTSTTSTTTTTLPGDTGTGWDESSFTTSGPLEPIMAESSSGGRPKLVNLLEAPDGTTTVMYLAPDGRVRWFQNAPDGDPLLAPDLRVGRLDRPLGEARRVTGFDVVPTPTGFLVAQEVTGEGVVLTAFDADLVPVAPVLVLDSLTTPALARDGDRVVLVASEAGRLQRLDLDVGATGPVVTGWDEITAPTGPASDHRPQVAVDGNRTVVTYERLRASGNDAQERALVLHGTDVVGDQPVPGPWAAAGMGTSAPPALAIDGKRALLLRRFTAGTMTWSSWAIALSDGAVTPLASGVRVSAATGMNDAAGYRLVHVDGALRLLGLDGDVALAQPLPGGKRTVARFQLLETTADGVPTDERLLLLGGAPVLADPLVVLDALGQNPDAAVAGNPVVIEAAVTNRGGRSAAAVTLTASVDGRVVQTIPLGSVASEKTVPVAFRWTPAAGETRRQVPMELAVTTTSPEYTTDNDTATFPVEVRQTAVITGRVADRSGALLGDDDYLPGVGGATVTLSTGATTVTEPGGFFAFEDVPFGPVTVTATAAGLRDVSVDLSPSRTQPYGHADLRTDSAGSVEIQVRDQAGRPLGGVTVAMRDHGPRATTGTDGSALMVLPAGTYPFTLAKSGYWPVERLDVQVAMGVERAQPVVMQEATEGIIGGRVIDRGGEPVGGATVTVDPVAAGEPTRTLTADADGRFGPVRLPAKPPAAYQLRATAAGVTGEGAADVELHGGELRSEVLVIAPAGADLGELRAASAIEGYTSWMVKASSPGFLEVPSAAMYVWFGNYAINLTSEYWSGTRELTGVDVAVEGLAYEAHATKSEVDLTKINGDYGSLVEGYDPKTNDASVFRNAFEVLVGAPEQLGASIADLTIGIVEAVTDDQDDAVVTGQGPELLTWSDAREDFRVEFGLDTSSPTALGRSVLDDIVAVPRGFAIPVVWGGASAQRTSVRVDRVEVVDAATGEVVAHSDDQWFSWSGGDGDNRHSAHLAVDRPGVSLDDVLVYVWLRVGKVDPGDLTGGAPTVHATSFEQRAQQVVILRPANGTLIGRIAPGDEYLHADRLHLPSG